MNRIRSQESSQTISLRRLLRCICIIAFSGITSIAQAESPREYVIKAAFLYNFAKFVDWPSESFAQNEETLELCVLGDNPFETALEAIQGKKAQGRKLTISHPATLDESSKCHLVFVSASEQERLPGIFPYLQERHVLSVSDMDNFAQQGGIVGLVTINNKIRFEINLPAAERAGLNISSNLLKLARLVEDEPGETN